MQNYRYHGDRLDISDDCSADDYKMVCRGLIRHNYEASNGMIDLPCDEDIKLVLKDKSGKVWGGVSGHIALYCFFIEELWIDESCQKKGYGKALMEKAEEIARSKGCLFAQTNTFSFQSPGFYINCGYEQIAIVEDFPDGVKHHYFKKVF